MSTKRDKRVFATGAERDTDADKLEFDGALSPIVLHAYAAYLYKHRVRPDGSIRPSRNWKLGMPKEAFMASGFRHFHDWWMEHEGYKSREGMEDALMGLLFNVMGYAHEYLKKKYELSQDA